ncbi:MAG: hypothetical protein R6U50_11205 [Desulfobacterales bacterium]
MKDKNGYYYYPFPMNKKVRMYVKRHKNEIFFRMWNQDDPQLWEEHGWVPHEAIEKATKLYKGKTFNPHEAYDVRLAKALLDGAVDD